MSEDDPFATPDSVVVASTAMVEGRAPTHERTVWRAAAWLLFFGTYAAVSGGGQIAVELSGQSLSGLGYVLLGVGVVQLAAGFELRRLRPHARVLGVVGCVPLLLLFPFGTWIAARCLVALLGTPGRTVLSPNYPVVLQEDAARPPLWVPLAAPFVLMGAMYFVGRWMLWG